MRIAFVIGRIAGTGGGGERVLRDVCSVLVERGHDVEVISWSRDTSPPLHAFDPRVHLVNLFHEPLSVLQKMRSLPFRFGWSGMKKYLSKIGPFSVALEQYFAVHHRPDAFIGYMGDGLCALYLMRSCRQIPLLASLHTSPERILRKHDAKSKITCSALAAADAVAFPLPEHFDVLNTRTNGIVRDLPNPISPVAAMNRPHHEREKVILVVGRLVPVKRVDKFLRAWSLCQAEFPDWTVKICGDGPERANLEKLADGLGARVQFAGETTEIFREYDVASLLVHPSEFEGFGLVLAEAMARGVPAIGFAESPGVRSLIVPGQNGWLVRDGSTAEALSSVMRDVLGDPEGLRRVGAQAHETVAKYMMPESVTPWEELLCELVDQTAIKPTIRSRLE